MAFDFPASPTEGQTFTPVGGPVYVFQSGVWNQQQSSAQTQITVGDAPPAAPVSGQFWWESDTGVLWCWYDDGNTQQWVQVAGPLATVPGTALADNILINPAIQHSQENPFNTNYSAGVFIADQWLGSYSGPAGGTNFNYYASPPSQNVVPYGYIGFAGTATPFPSMAAANWLGVTQWVEGIYSGDLSWGTAGAAIPAVLSFEALSTMAGTFAVAIRSGGGTTVTISFPIVFAAGETNIWKKFTFAVPPATIGTFPRDTSKGLELWFTAAIGSNYAAPSNGIWATGGYIGVAGQSNLLSVANQSFYVRAIGLYPDPLGTGVAPVFNPPDFALELLRCQRYFLRQNGLICQGYNSAGAGVYETIPLPVTMRVAPTSGTVTYSGQSYNNASAVSFNSAQPNQILHQCIITAAGAGYAVFNVAVSARL